MATENTSRSISMKVWGQLGLISRPMNLQSDLLPIAIAGLVVVISIYLRHLLIFLSKNLIEIGFMLMGEKIDLAKDFISKCNLAKDFA